MVRISVFGFIQLAVVLTFSLALLGCGGGKKFTEDEFKTVTKDMPEASVLAILGKPAETMESVGVRRLFWESQGKYYSISFGDGKVNAPMVHGSKEDYDMMKGLMKMAGQMDKK